MDTLTAVVLICHAVTIDQCDYRSAVAVHRAATTPVVRRLADHELPNTLACHLNGADAAKRYRSGLAPGDIATWQCVPTMEADAVGIK